MGGVIWCSRRAMGTWSPRGEDLERGMGAWIVGWKRDRMEGGMLTAKRSMREEIKELGRK